MSPPFATKEGTRKYFQTHPIHEDKYRHLGDLVVSAIGIGTYLGNSDDRTDLLYEKAIKKSVKSGINFFDTAINYRCQRSERCVAFAIKELAEEGISRDQIVVSTKGGFLPSLDEPENFENYIRSNYLEKGVITRSDIVANCYCMTPKFLECEINQSLKNLQLECIDLYYLHNPEMQLLETQEESFYEKICEVFEMLEKIISQGKIKRYGVATWNGFRQKIKTKGLLSLEKLIECAKKAGGSSHHFKTIQLPFNLVMLEAMKVKNQQFENKTETILEVAKNFNISTVISAPLMQSQVLNLPARLFDEMPKEPSSMLKALQFVLSTKNIDSALVGAKSTEHIEENAKILNKPDWTDAEMKHVYKSLGI